MPRVLVERLDDYCRELSEAADGLTVSRSDAARMLVKRGLDGYSQRSAAA